MFKVLTGEKKRRVISPATITASVFAHLLLLGGLVYANTGPGEPLEVVGPPIELPELVEEKKEPPPAPVEEKPAPPAPAGEAAKVPATALEVTEVTVPDTIVPEPPGVEPIDATRYERDGARGPAIVPPAPRPTGPTTDGGGTGTKPPYPMALVEELPVLDQTGLRRALERNYPAMLRDARVSGRVIVELVVDENGHPIPSSARVIEASHPAFGEATLRMVERFRFRPARINGTAVPVVVTIPIVWTAR